MRDVARQRRPQRRDVPRISREAHGLRVQDVGEGRRRILVRAVLGVHARVHSVERQSGETARIHGPSRTG